MRNFVVADPSLKGVSGHHFETSVTIARAAADLGFRARIFAHRSYAGGDHDGQVITPYFSAGLYGAEDEAAKADALRACPEGASDTARVLWSLAAHYDPWGAWILFPVFRVLAIVLSALGIRLGVNPNDLSGAQPRANPAQPKRPVAGTTFSKRLLWFAYAPIAVLRILRGFVIGTNVSGPTPSKLAEELLKLTEQLGLDIEDLVVIHTATPHTISHLVEYAFLRGLRLVPQMHVILRYDENAMPESLPLGPFEPLRRASQAGLLGTSLHLYAETEALASYYSSNSGCDVEVLHHACPSRSTDGGKRSGSEPICVGYFGDAREEKGFHTLPSTIRRLLNGTSLKPAGLRFVVQVCAHDRNQTSRIAEAIADLRVLAKESEAVVLLEGPLSSNAYQEALRQCDVVVLPYSSYSYQRRGSGVLVDALRAVCLVIAPAATWIGEQAVRFGGLAFSDSRPLWECLREIQMNRQRFSLILQSRMDLVNREFGADKLVGTIAAKKKAPANRPIVLHIAPAWLGQGSTAVYRSQLQYLRRRGYSVISVLLTTDFELNRDSPRVIGETVSRTVDLPCSYRTLLAMDVSYRSLGTVMELSKLGRKDSVQHQLVRRRLLSIPPHLRRILANSPPAAGVVNYFYNVPVLDMLGLKDLPYVLEMHDLQIDQHRLRHPDADLDLDASQEKQAIASAPVLIAINEDEAKFAREVSAPKRVCVAYPTPSKRMSLRQSICGCVTAADIFRAAGLLDRASAQVLPSCRVDLLFVGTDHTANVKSLTWFVEECFVPFLRPFGISLVAAGSIAGNTHSPQTRGLCYTGTVEFLEPLYAAAKVVVLPVAFGAGLPIKTIEALSFGKCVSGVPFAYRGLPFDPRDLSASEDPTSLAIDIRKLLGSASMRRARARQAHALWHAHLSPLSYSSSWDRAMATIGFVPPPLNSEGSSMEFGYSEWTREDRLLSYVYRRLLMGRTPRLSSRAQRQLKEYYQNDPEGFHEFGQLLSAKSAPLFTMGNGLDKGEGRDVIGLEKWASEAFSVDVSASSQVKERYAK